MWPFRKIPTTGIEGQLERLNANFELLLTHLGAKAPTRPLSEVEKEDLKTEISYTDPLQDFIEEIKRESGAPPARFAAEPEPEEPFFDPEPDVFH